MVLAAFKINFFIGITHKNRLLTVSILSLFCRHSEQERQRRGSSQT